MTQMLSLRRWLAPLMLLLGMALQPALAQQAPQFQPINPPIQTDAGGKIEVIEFFSYGCPHCADFNPLIHAWSARLGADVAFKKVPITFGRPAWTNVAKLYYALETTGDLAKLDDVVFKAIHEQRVNLFDPRTAEEWVAKQGADGKKFAEAFASFGVNSKMSRAEQIARAYKVDGVPMVVVDGRYVVKGESFKDVLNNADLLIEKVRAEKGGKKK
jgi:thiol:disulfide interchange protein DsbA